MGSHLPVGRSQVEAYSGIVVYDIGDRSSLQSEKYHREGKRDDGCDGASSNPISEAVSSGSKFVIFFVEEE